MLQVLEMPEITQALGTVCCDPQLLMRLSLTQRYLHKLISSGQFAACIAGELHCQGVEWAKGCKRLEEIALGKAVHGICAQPSKNHLYFQYGGGTEVRAITKPLLENAASLGRRHPLLRVHVDSHVGGAAPTGLATMISQRRGISVVAELATRGIAEERTSMRAWGRTISSVWSEPEDTTAARAELFFSLGGVQFPQREAYYNLVPKDQWPPTGATQAHSPPSSEDEGDDDGRPGLRNTDGRLVQLPNGQILPLGLLRRLIEADSDEAESDDSDDSEDAQMQLTSDEASDGEVTAEATVVDGAAGGVTAEAEMIDADAEVEVIGSAAGEVSEEAEGNYSLIWRWDI